MIVAWVIAAPIFIVGAYIALAFISDLLRKSISKMFKD